jgi:acetyltransferase-like isoleucine patch superfamily enzyme
VHAVPDDRVPPPPHTFAAYGEGSWVVPPARVARPERIAIGRKVVVMEHATLRVLDGGDVAAGDGPLLTIGDGSTFGRFATVVCGVGVHIGADVATSDSAMIFDTWETSDGASYPPPWPASPVIIEDGAYLGFNCIVYPGVTVGAGAFVGEGAVVTDDVPAHSIVYGNPATIRGQWDAASGQWAGEAHP